MARVNVIYHHFPHYRAPVLRALRKHGIHQYNFWGGVADHEGIKAFKGDPAVTIRPIRFIVDRSTGRMDIGGFWPAVSDREADALIIIGNPNIRATWMMAVVGRLLGKKVMFWAHGWLKPEPFLKRHLRNFYFGLANRVLVYGTRARQLAAKSGFPASRVSVIYNSLDWDASQSALTSAGLASREVLRGEFGLPLEAKVLICTARLTALCQFDVLIEAVAQLKGSDERYHIALVGDGPERGRLESLALERGVNVTFFGSIYDEVILAKLYKASDLTVSPGKVGLTAVHSLTYGVPVVTHGDLDEQMPEVEAIEDGVTGAFFGRGDASDLANTISRWFRDRPDAPVVEEACMRTVAERFTPYAQVKLIDDAVSSTLNGTPRAHEHLQ